MLTYYELHGVFILNISHMNVYCRSTMDLAHRNVNDPAIQCEVYLFINIIICRAFDLVTDI